MPGPHPQNPQIGISPEILNTELMLRITRVEACFTDEESKPTERGGLPTSCLCVTRNTKRKVWK